MFIPKGRLGELTDRHMNYVDMAYFLGIVLVVWGHSHPISSDWWGTWYSDLNAFIYSFHIPLFFFIGGYLMVFSKSIDELGFLKWAAEKLKKFLVPYLVLTAVAFIPKAMLGDTTDVVELSIGYFLKTTFLIPRQGVWGHFWFIATFLVTEIFWGLWRSKVASRKLISRILFFIGVAGCLVMMIWPVYTDYLMINDLRFHAIFYPCGIVTAMIKPVLWNKKWKNLIAIILTAAGVWLLYPYGNFQYCVNPFINFAVAMLLVWCVWNMAVLLGRKQYGLVRFLVRDAFTVFVYSWPAQAVADVILRRLGINWVTAIGILFVTGFVFPLLLAGLYRRFQIVHCGFLDVLLGVRTISKRTEVH